MGETKSYSDGPSHAQKIINSIFFADGQGCVPSLLFDLRPNYVKVVQSCPTLCDPMDYSLWNSPGQNTGWVTFPFSRGSSQPRD